MNSVWRSALETDGMRPVQIEEIHRPHGGGDCRQPVGGGLWYVNYGLYLMIFQSR